MERVNACQQSHRLCCSFLAEGNFLNRSRSLSFSTFMLVSQKNPFGFLDRFSKEYVDVCAVVHIWVYVGASSSSFHQCICENLYIWRRVQDEMCTKANHETNKKIMKYIVFFGNISNSPWILINYRFTLCETSSSSTSTIYTYINPSLFSLFKCW